MQKKYQNHEKNHLLSQLTFTYFKLQVKNFHYRKPVSKVTLTDHYSVTIKKNVTICPKTYKMYMILYVLIYVSFYMIQDSDFKEYVLYTQDSCGHFHPSP